jgi:hypothetical protein
MLDGCVLGSGGQYFKFENMWPKSERFVEQVTTWWLSYNFQRSPSFVLMRKLKPLNTNLKKWNEEVFGNVGKQKQKKKMIFWMEFVSLILLQREDI